MSREGDTYNRGGLIAFVFSMAFSFLFFIYIIFIHAGVDLKEVPKNLPAAQVHSATAKADTFDPTSVAKPWVPNPEMAKYGHQVFLNNCAVCHGKTAHGDGPAGLTLHPHPRNLVKGNWKRGGTSIALFTTLEEGLPGTNMVSFKQLPKTDRWALVQFIRSITKNKIKDDPKALEKFAMKAE